MITKELVHSLFEIKDGLFYHKERPIRNGRDKIFNEKYSGKLAGHNGNCYKVTIKNKQYKVSDILDFLETGEFIVKTRNIPRFEALRFVQRNNKTVVVGYHSSEVEANSEYVRARLSYIDDLYTKYKDTVDSRVWECVRDSRWW